ncbi:MAG: ABC transporter ATP-binding protein [Planctomycetota bacterium]
METDVLLEIRDLETRFFTSRGIAPAVDGVSLVVRRGKALGLVGESGCGKSMTAFSVLRLIPNPPGRITGGKILFEGVDLLTLPETAMRDIRGNKIAMIFQEPQSALNPVLTVGYQIMEGIRLHQKVSRSEARDRAVELLRRVKIPSPEMRINDYPHQLSGGMKQRVMIAMALGCNPSFLIADEPTTALDVTVQAQILELLREIQAEFKMSILLITHDLGVVAEMAEDVAVMYAGKIVEYTSAAALFARPLHPYTQGLFHSLPRMGGKKERLTAIPGTVPSPVAWPPGCRFHPRCARALPECRIAVPPLREIEPGHRVACVLDFQRRDS